jgi:NADH-quinone oxidoreductase subunit N
MFTNLLIVLAVLSMTYGNLSALAQTDVKRLLAFSSISHAGYMMTGILNGTTNGYAAAMFYVGGYLLMNLALFYVVYSLAPNGQNVSIDDLKGLHRRAPLLAFTLAVAAFGLAGIPPTVGFSGKFFCLTAAFQKGHMWLVILGVINTAISIFYYLRMVRAAYAPPEASANEVQTGAIALSFPAKVLGAGFAAAILVVGAFPGALLDLFRSAFH